MKLNCHECGQSCTNDVLPDNFVIRAWIVCGDCQDKIPQAAFDAVFKATSKNGKRYIDTPDDEFQMVPGPDAYPNAKFDLKSLAETGNEHLANFTQTDTMIATQSLSEEE